MVLNKKCVLVVISSYLRTAIAMDPLLKDLLTPIPQLGEKCGYESCPPIQQGWTNVHIVPHSHAELGLAKNFLQYYSGESEGGAMKIRMNWKTIFDSTISELWADKTRKFTISGSELPLFFHWWARRDGTVRRMVYACVRQGRLVLVGGGWGMHDEASAGYQAIIDSYTYSLRKINATFLSCGRPLVAWQADSLGHSRESASLLAQMGFDALYINPISFDDEVLRMERRALEFVWRGNDDLGAATDVFTHKLFDGYWSPPGFCFSSTCDDPLLVTSDGVFTNVDERIEQFVSHIRHRQAPHYTTKHVMVMMGQSHGYFDAKLWFDNVDKLIDKFNTRTYKNNEKMHAMYSTPACYLKAVYEDNPILETKQDDFFPYAYNKHTYTTGIFTTRPTLKYLIKESNVFLQMAKQLQVLTNLGNNDMLFENFNWIMSLMQDHTIISGGLREHVKSYYVEKLHSAVQWATELFQQAFNTIRGSPPSTEYHLCFLNISSCPNTKLDRFYITIYNPLAWPVTMPVRLPIRNTRYDVFDPSGAKIKAIKISIPDHIFDIPNRVVQVTNELVFIAQNIPAMGLRSYFIETQEKRRTKKSLIKKITKNQQKIYFIKQIPNENKTYFEHSNDYGNFDENKPEIKPEFGSIDKLEDIQEYDAITPKYNSDVESTIKDFDESHIDMDTAIPIKNFNASVGPVSKNDSIDKYNDDELANIPYSNESNIRSFEEIRKTDINASNNTSYDEFQNTANSNESSSIIDDKTDNTSINEGVNTFQIVRQESNGQNIAEHQSFSGKNISSIKNDEENDTPAIGEENNQTFSKTERTTEINIVETSANIQGNIRKLTRNEDNELDTSKNGNNNIKMVDVLNVPKFKTWVPESNSENLEKPIVTDTSDDVYNAKESKDNFIRNQYIQINLDEDRKISSMRLSNGVNTSLDIQYYCYISDEPGQNSTKKQPGAFVFRSADVNPEPIIDFIETKVYKSVLVEEIHTRYAKYASFAVKLYSDSPVVEIDWVVGPVPVDDGYGREVFLRYTTDLENNGVFYTDSNGRQTIKRIRHFRPTYEPYSLDPVAGNFYPVTSRIYIEDEKKNLRLSIFNDRAQGGSSLLEGAIDLMVHRRILTDDTGAWVFINETEDGKGLIVRGSHHLYLTKADYKQNRIFEKKFVKELELKPQIMFNRIIQDVPREEWIRFNNEFTAINKKLPIGIHVLTIQEWNDNTILLRLENYLEKIDIFKSGVKKVNVNDLFVNVKILSLTEMTLAGNVVLEDHVKLDWRINGSFYKSFNDFYGSNGKVEYSNDDFKLVDTESLSEGVTLMPQQIRTFVVKYEYVKN